MENGRKLILYIFLTALVIRLAYVIFFFGLDTLPDYDSPEYIRYAENLLAGNGYTDGKWKSFRSPGYPAFLAGVYSVFGESVPAVKIVQAAISSLIPVLVFLIGLKLGGRRVALTAAGISCVYFGLIDEPGHVISEAVFTFLFAAAVCALLYARSLGSYAAAGVIIGIATLTRPVSLLLFFAAAAWITVQYMKQKEFLLKRLAVLTLAFCLVLLPWIVRNYRLHDVFVYSAMETGYCLKILNFGMTPVEAVKYDNLKEYDRDQKYLQEALGRLLEMDKYELLKSRAVRLVGYFYPFMPLYDLPYALLFPFWLFGMYLVLRNGDRRAYILFIVLMYLPVIVVFAPATRYRHSMSPYFIVLSAMAIEHFLNSGNKKRFIYSSALWAAFNLAIMLNTDRIRAVCKSIAGSI